MAAVFFALLVGALLCEAARRAYRDARVDGPAAAFQRLVDPLLGWERWVNDERDTIVRARGVDDDFRATLRDRGLHPEGEGVNAGG